MNAAKDIAEFLATRRAKLSPEQVGLPSYGKRRVPGLRREEVASLAGVSADYYRRLERGQVSGVSELVLEALARALRLDDAERAHLFDLARAVSPVAVRGARPAKRRVRPVVLRLLEQIEAAAIVSNVHGDYLAANPLGRALYAAGVREPGAACEQRALHVPGSGGARVLSRVGPARRQSSWPRCARRRGGTRSTATCRT